MTPKPPIPTDPPDFVPDELPDTLATPEGDAQDPPNQPLSPANVVTPERPRGDEPHSTEPLRNALD